MAAQLALYGPPGPSVSRPARQKDKRRAPLCASCRAREARYGFRADKDDPVVERPRTLCFDCFRVEVARRQELARTVQVRLPLEQTLESLTHRRRQAQIAARKAAGVR